MNWNFKKTSEFSWILFRITCRKPCIKTSIVMHVHYMNIRQSIAKVLLSVYKAL